MHDLGYNMLDFITWKNERNETEVQNFQNLNDGFSQLNFHVICSHINAETLKKGEGSLTLLNL